MTMKVLLVLTSNDKLGDSGEQTGWYLSECAHPHAVFSSAHGVEMVFASPNGGEAPVDEGSVEATKDDEVSTRFWNGDGPKLCGDTKKLADVKSDEFDVVFVVGGFGTMWDLPDNADLQDILRNTYERGGVVSAVCHGPCALANVQLKSGSYLVKDRRVAAFSDDEERSSDRIDKVPFTNEQRLMERGAIYCKRGPWQPQVVTDGRIVTGQNPQSATGVALAVLAACNGML